MTEENRQEIGVKCVMVMFFHANGYSETWRKRTNAFLRLDPANGSIWIESGGNFPRDNNGVHVHPTCWFYDPDAGYTDEMTVKEVIVRIGWMSSARFGTFDDLYNFVKKFIDSIKSGEGINAPVAENS